MKVTDMYVHHGRDVFALDSLDGEVVDQGKLVGNIWGTVQKLLISQEQGNALKSTDRSIAAMLPVSTTP